jgi:YggT family protein
MLQLILGIISIIKIIIIISAVLSWIRVSPYHPVVQFINQISEPILAPFRKIIPPERIGIDLSPVFVFLLLSLLERFVVRIF